LATKWWNKSLLFNAGKERIIQQQLDEKNEENRLVISNRALQKELNDKRKDMIAETKILQTLKKEFNDRIDALKEMENQKKNSGRKNWEA
jgi:hypothetical protein